MFSYYRGSRRVRDPVETEFLAPRLVGKRFEGASIPLEMLRDLAALEDMLVEVAKWVFLERNVTRQRLPRGFAESIHLRLIGVREGSAVPIIMLQSSEDTLLPLGHRYQPYLDEARDLIIGTIAAANDSASSSFGLPAQYLSYFDRLGRSLRDDERIEFESKDGRPASLTREVRSKLLSASSIRTISEEVTLRGSLPVVDQGKLTFEVALINGQRIPGVISEEHLETFLEGYIGYRTGLRVAIAGIARFERNPKRLKVIESVERISLLDELDVAARVDELRLLNDGWLEGRGLALSATGLDWFVASFQREFSGDLPLPYVYPTEDGGLRLEWDLGSLDLSIDVDLASKSGALHALDRASDSDRSETLNLAGDGWARIREIVGTAVIARAGEGA